MNRFNKSLVFLLILFALVFSALGIVAPAQAAALSVTNINDSGAGSLRQAIMNAAAGDTITFANTLSGKTITLASVLTLTKDVTIDGSALASQISVSGNNAAPVFAVNSGITVTLKSLKVIRGKASGFNGGGVYNGGTLTIINSTIAANLAGSNGGGIMNAGGALTVINSTFSGNSAVAYGGGIDNAGGTLTITNSTFSGNVANKGGGIYNDGSTLNATNNTFSSNKASGGGGDIYNDGTSLTLANNILANSVAGGDCSGAAATAALNNLLEVAGCGITNGASGNVTGVDPKLGALASNGGPTQTFALLAHSPAINAGDNATCAAAPVNGKDQRAIARPQGVLCDIGAFELVDHTAPTTSITGKPASPSKVTSATFSFSGTDSGSGVDKFQCKLDTNTYTACITPQKYTGLSVGQHTFYVRAIDVLGNIDASPASYSWLVDTIAPDTTISGKPGTPSPSSVTFSLTLTDNAGGSGMGSFQCKMDAGAYAACTSPKNYTGLTIGQHTFSVRGIDKAGNVDATPATYSWRVGSERVKDGGFNIYPTQTSKIPSSWKSAGFNPTTTDGKDTTNKKEGIASIRINGELGASKALSQTITLSGVSGDKFRFSYWMKGNAIPAGGVCEGQVTFLSGANPVGSSQILPCGSAGSVFQQRVFYITASGSFTNVKIAFVYVNDTGTVWFDLASLLK